MFYRVVTGFQKAVTAAPAAAGRDSARLVVAAATERPAGRCNLRPAIE
jgi:hypothetical protein